MFGLYQFLVKGLSKVRIFSGLVCVAYIYAHPALAQSPVTVAVNAGSPGAAVSPDFGYFSFEMGGLQYDEPGWVNYGYFFNPTNTQLITLFQDLGVRSVRIGGNSGDDFIPTDSEIDSFFQFAEVARVKAVFALDLKTGTPAQAASEAQYVWNNYSTNLLCFAIGNEPEAYPASTEMTNFSSYFSTWQTFVPSVLAAAPGAVLGGPDNESAAISYAPDFCQAEQGNTNIPYFQYHYKPGGSANGISTSTLIADEMSSSWESSDYSPAYSELGAMAQSYGFSYRFTEFNAFVAPSNNPPGEYTPYSSALYMLDAYSWWAAHGCRGLHIHTGPGMGYLSAFYYDQNGNLQVYPVCYGVAAFNVGGYGNVLPLTITNTAALNLTAYSVENGTNLYVTIINREYGTGARNASVTIQPNGILSGNVSAMFLVQANNDVTATNGVTLGGASISGTNIWQGQWTSLGTLANGQCVVSVPATSAAIVMIQATSLFIPPVITTNLTAQVLLETGNTYSYSVGATGALPLSYQWYQGSTPIAGQTNSSYLVTGGNPGSSTYSVVITNIYGAITSSVSALTVYSLPTNSFAAAVAQLNPAGYWPMHEVEPGVAGDIETNYGSLGLLGTGYYPDWASSTGIALKRQHAGPMSGDSDPDVAVNFTHNEITGSAVEFTNGLFVPHTSPFTTLNPPFTVECWFYPTNLSTGVDVWSQDGNEGLNAGGEGGGVGYVNGLRLVWVNSGMVTYGFDEVYNPYALININPYRLAGLGGANLASNEWIHLVLTCDVNLNMTLYTNGAAQAGTLSCVGRYAPDNWTPLSIGCGYGDERSIAGYLSEFAVYTNALQPGDIAYHHAVGTSANPQTNYFTAVMNDNPAIYLRMNSPTYAAPPASKWPALYNFGTTNGAAVGNGVYTPGTMPGILPGPAGSSAYVGVTNNSAQLSGVSSFADAGSAPVYNPTGSSANFSVMALFRGNPCDGRIQSIVGHGTNSWQLTMTTNGCLVFNAGNGNQAAGGTGQAAGDLMTVGIYNDGNWHQVVAVASTNVISIYVDGLLDTNGTPNGITKTSVIPGNTSDVIIGSDPIYTNNPVGVGRQFAGQICDMAFFTNALAGAQVQALYESAITPLSEAITFTNSGQGQLQLNWSYGTLQTATNVAGPYNDLLNTSSPFTISETNSQQFYRIREN